MKSALNELKTVVEGVATAVISSEYDTAKQASDGSDITDNKITSWSVAGGDNKKLKSLKIKNYPNSVWLFSVTTCKTTDTGTAEQSIDFSVNQFLKADGTGAITTANLEDADTSTQMSRTAGVDALMRTTKIWAPVFELQIEANADLDENCEIVALRYTSGGLSQ